jgi:hypothetical protein
MTTSEFRETLTARLHILVNDWLAPEYLRTAPYLAVPMAPAETEKQWATNSPCSLTE